jgi:hypothetical protein
MPKNIKGGNKTKKGKNRRPPAKLIFKNSVIGTDYALVVANLGNGRCELKLIKPNGFEAIQGIIRGSTRRQKFIKNDIILVGNRNFLDSDSKKVVDIIHKYNADHIQQLIYFGEITKFDSNLEENCIIFSKEHLDNIYDSDNEDTNNLDSIKDTINDTIKKDTIKEIKDNKQLFKLTSTYNNSYSYDAGYPSDYEDELESDINSDSKSDSELNIITEVITELNIKDNNNSKEYIQKNKDTLKKTKKIKDTLKDTLKETKNIFTDLLQETKEDEFNFDNI